MSDENPRSQAVQVEDLLRRTLTQLGETQTRLDKLEEQQTAGTKPPILSLPVVPTLQEWLKYFGPAAVDMHMNYSRLFFIAQNLSAIVERMGQEFPSPTDWGFDVKNRLILQWKKGSEEGAELVLEMTFASEKYLWGVFVEGEQEASSIGKVGDVLAVEFVAALTITNKEARAAQ